MASTSNRMKAIFDAVSSRLLVKKPEIPDPLLSSFDSPKTADGLWLPNGFLE